MYSSTSAWRNTNLRIVRVGFGVSFTLLVSVSGRCTSTTITTWTPGCSLCAGALLRRRRRRGQRPGRCRAVGWIAVHMGGQLIVRALFACLFARYWRSLLVHVWAHAFELTELCFVSVVCAVRSVAVARASRTLGSRRWCLRWRASAWCA